MTLESREKPYVIKAACACITGDIRKNNEDNFCFNGHCLPTGHTDLEEYLAADGS